MTAKLAGRAKQPGDDIPPLMPPPHAPQNWEIGPPDFVGVGTQRSGTTWWWAMLAEHSRITRVELRNKEVHFFDQYTSVTEVDPKVYHRYFPRPPGTISGEWTPRYMYDYWIPPMLARAAPDAKLLVLLRDPLARFLSGVSLLTGRGHPMSRTLLNEQVKRSLYGHQLRTLFDSFPQDQVLILQYEQCQADPVANMRRTLEFIGLDPGQWHGQAAIERKVSLSFASKPDINPATRAALIAGFQADQALISELAPAVDLDLWPTMSEMSVPVSSH